MSDDIAQTHDAFLSELMSDSFAAKVCALNTKNKDEFDEHLTEPLESLLREKLAADMARLREEYRGLFAEINGNS